ncbi:MAG: helix-turn-helix transcriptional regulator [Pseudomonadota bacterium]
MKNAVRELREARGWSQARLAEELDVTRQTVLSIEKGRYDPSLSLALKIGRVFETRVEDIFDPEG